MGCIRVTHPCAGRRQMYCYIPAAPRLACVKPVASVHPEPGSNSPLFLYLFRSFTILICLSSKYQNLAAQKSPLIIESSRKPFQSRLSSEKKSTSFVLLSSRCNSFNLLFRLPRCALAVRKLCKGKTKNSFVQILFDFFSNFFFLH